MKHARRKWIVATAVVVTVIGVGMVLHLRLHFGYFLDDKDASEAAEKALIQQYNAQEFEAIYDNSADQMKAAQHRGASLAALKQAFDTYGTITEDVSAATTCFPEQVRMVRWLRSSKGQALTAMMLWYVPDGRSAKLAMLQVTNTGHAPVRPEIVHAHSCSQSD